MNMAWYILYNFALALWVGGIVLFTFVVTPVIFKTYSRDTAAEIVGRLFPRYFLYNLLLSVLAAFLLFLNMMVDVSAASNRLSLVLILAAVMMNLFVLFKLHPDIVSIKQEVESFEREPPDSPARRKFKKLHVISALLNLFLLADGVALLIATPFLIRK